MSGSPSGRLERLLFANESLYRQFVRAVFVVTAALVLAFGVARAGLLGLGPTASVFGTAAAVAVAVFVLTGIVQFVVLGRAYERGTREVAETADTLEEAAEEIEQTAQQLAETATEIESAAQQVDGAADEVEEAAEQVGEETAAEDAETAAEQAETVREQATDVQAQTEDVQETASDLKETVSEKKERLSDGE
ncbi:MAG: hypothetical protein ABEH35_01855 [Haloarculaceae archaeon]